MHTTNTRSALLTRGRLLEAATLGWNVVGIVVLAVAAISLNPWTDRRFTAW
jgi:hypothetical protein